MRKSDVRYPASSGGLDSQFFGSMPKKVLVTLEAPASVYNSDEN
jgi:hypothetical protein